MLKWMLSREQLVRDTREAEDVVATIRRLAAQHLRAGVGGRPRSSAQAAAGECGGRAEVDGLRVFFARQEYVAGLEVAVHDVVLVRVIQRQCTRAQDLVRERSWQHRPIAHES